MKHTTARRGTGLAIAAAALTLTACTEIQSVNVARVLAGEDPIIADDYIGQTFPAYFARALRTGDGSAPDLGSGIAAVTFDSANQFTITIPGTRGAANETYVFTRVGLSDDYTTTVNGDTLTITVLNLGPYGVGFIPGTEGVGADQAFQAYFGFETPFDQRPATARYNDDSFGAVFLGVNNESDFLAMFCEDCVDLRADFGAATISGQVFDQSMDVGGTDIAITNRLEDGTINNEGFTGTIVTDITVTEPGMDPVGLEAALEDQRTDGRFFGVDGEVATITYDGTLGSVPDGALGDDAGQLFMSGASDARDNSLVPF